MDEHYDTIGLADTIGVADIPYWSAQDGGLLLLLNQHVANVHFWRQQIIDYNMQFLPPVWVTWMEFWTLDCGLDQPWLLQAGEKSIRRLKIYLSLFISLSLCLPPKKEINNLKKLEVHNKIANRKNDRNLIDTWKLNSMLL